MGKLLTTRPGWCLMIRNRPTGAALSNRRPDLSNRRPEIDQLARCYPTGACWPKNKLCGFGSSRCDDGMIQQRIGDLLEIEEDGKFFYVVVLTKVVMFGGNILFAFHSDGKKRHQRRKQ